MTETVARFLRELPVVLPTMSWKRVTPDVPFREGLEVCHVDFFQGTAPGWFITVMGYDEPLAEGGRAYDGVIIRLTRDVSEQVFHVANAAVTKGV